MLESKPSIFHKPPQLLIFIAYAAYWGYMAISPTDRLQWLVENLLPLACIAVLIVTYKWYRFSTLSYFLLFLFLGLHTYAAHYTYAGTPFDTWLKGTFGTSRSYYDRVVHFAFGLLLTYPFLELVSAYARFRHRWIGIALSLAIVASFGAIFEILEMGAALIAGTGSEERYVGMQGDVFDTQKDMAAALVGGILTVVAIALFGQRDHANNG